MPFPVQTLFSLVPVLGALGLSARGGLVESTPVSEFRTRAPDFDATESALTFDGMSVNWQIVGNPFEASKIAACAAGVVFALNDDATLYKGDGGMDSLGLIL